MVSSWLDFRLGIQGSIATRAQPSGLRIPDVHSGPSLVGTRPVSPSGNGTSAPALRTNARGQSGSLPTSSSPRPNSSASARAQGLRARKLSAAASTTKPSKDSVRIFPPSLSSRSSRTMRAFSRVGSRSASTPSAARRFPGFSSRCTTVRPARPPPTTATVAACVASGGDTLASRSADGRAVPRTQGL